MTTDEKLALLQEWERIYSDLDAKWQALHALTGATTDSQLGDAVWLLWDAYTRQVGEREAALMAKLEAAEKERDALRSEVESWRGLAQQFGNEADALRAKIEAMEKQEPVASVWRCDNGHIHGSCERTLPMGTKLYALPGAKGEEK